MRTMETKYDENGDISPIGAFDCEHYCDSSRWIFNPSFLIRLRSVDGGTPRIAAAPRGPEIRPPVWLSTFRMCSRSFSVSDSNRLAPFSGAADAVPGGVSVIDMAGSTRIEGGTIFKIAP